MKKIICICMAALMALSALVGCSSAGTASNDSAGETPTGKVVVNFEGIVTAVNENEVTLENGKIVVISDATVFAGDPDTNNAISKEIVVGNFIQGYTSDDPAAERVSADKIYCNAEAQPGSGKLVINFEGKVAAVDGDCITLDNGQVILISEDTVFSIPSGIVENVIMSEGYSIQGYTAGDPAASEIAATRIHIMAF